MLRDRRRKTIRPTTRIPEAIELAGCELARSSPKMIGGLPGVRRELAEGDQELTRSSPKVIESLLGVRKEFTER
ncbi:hypothetical protein B296_00021974 [Ensete ventricosum]|uniref:Uncharacterized protein n=1 Tax=Ensete ventricosum TaxID=4639 RepID=A0A426YTA4_ENSVE|nr:hypothetical protein B296_00021974 [Ensete ventricosum]